MTSFMLFCMKRFWFVDKYFHKFYIDTYHIVIMKLPEGTTDTVCVYTRIKTEQ